MFPRYIIVLLPISLIETITHTAVHILLVEVHFESDVPDNIKLPGKRTCERNVDQKGLIIFKSKHLPAAQA